MRIPTFKNTEQALSFARHYKEDKIVIKALKLAYRQLRTEAMALIREGQEAEGFYLLSGQCQFINEAIKEIKK